MAKLCMELEGNKVLGFCDWHQNTVKKLTGSGKLEQPTLSNIDPDYTMTYKLG
jgi:hypothetical protein